MEQSKKGSKDRRRVRERPARKEQQVGQRTDRSNAEQEKKGMGEEKKERNREGEGETERTGRKDQQVGGQMMETGLGEEGCGCTCGKIAAEHKGQRQAMRMDALFQCMYPMCVLTPSPPHYSQQ